MEVVDSREQVLTALWTPRGGVRVMSSELPDPWSIALGRLASDLRVRQYGDRIERIEWVASYDADDGLVWVHTAITVTGCSAGEMGCTGTGARIDDDVETVLFWVAEMVQNAVADVRTAWPWGDAGGFMNPELIQGVAVWRDRNGDTTPIGQLAE